MKCSRFIYLLIVMTLAFVIFACSGKPVEQIQLTEKAMQQAKDEHAEEFAPEDWKAADTAWRDAQTKIEQQKWGDSTTLLLKAKTRFEKARDLAKGKRAAAIQEIEGTKVTAEKRCKALKDALEAGGKKLSAAKRKEFEEACKSAEEKIANVATKLQNGQYNDARYLAQSTLREVWEAQKELDGLTGKKGT